jgi:hypothetical protein
MSTLPQMPDQTPDEGEQWPYLSETLLWGTTAGSTKRSSRHPSMLADEGRAKWR